MHHHPKSQVPIGPGGVGFTVPHVPTLNRPGGGFYGRNFPPKCRRPGGNRVTLLHVIKDVINY